MNRTILSAVCAAALALCSSSAWAQQKTAKQCSEEWTANKASIQASGKTKKAFVAECRGQAAAAAPAAPATATRPTPSQAAPTPTTTQPRTNRAMNARPRESVTSGAAPAAGQFGTEIAAKAHCPADTVVWANLGSKIYHFAGSRDYGNTKRGAYMCEREAAGFRAAKNEKHP
jgi:hypothetical protein